MYAATPCEGRDDFEDKPTTAMVRHSSRILAIVSTLLMSKFRSRCSSVSSVVKDLKSLLTAETRRTRSINVPKRRPHAGPAARKHQLLFRPVAKPGLQPAPARQSS